MTMALTKHEAAQVCLEFFLSHFKKCSRVFISEIKIDGAHSTVIDGDLECYARISIEADVGLLKKIPQADADQGSAKSLSPGSSVVVRLSPLECDCSSKKTNFL